MPHPHYLSHITHADFDTALTGIDDIAPLKRRRLSPLARLALHTARTTLTELASTGETVDYIIWSSCYGDENITASIISEIAHGDTPSPTQFSLSVHNAISGLYSIFYQDATPATSLSSPLHSSLTDAITEAISYLSANGKHRALIVYYDAPLPEIYHTPDVAIRQAFALSAIVSVDAVVSVDKDTASDIAILPNPNPLNANPNPQAQDLCAQDFYTWYQSDTTVPWHSSLWQLTKAGA